MMRLYKEKGIEILDSILQDVVYSKPGAIPFLFFGKQISTASLPIRIGRNFEKWFKFIAKDCGMELLDDGVIKNVFEGKSKDIDLLFKDKKTKTIYYMEAKSNLLMDTEKSPATLNKVKIIREYLEKKYPEYKIVSSLLHWGAYEPNILSTPYISKAKKAKKAGISVIYPIDFFKIVGADISEADFYAYFKTLGVRIKSVSNHSITVEQINEAIANLSVKERTQLVI